MGRKRRALSVIEKYMLPNPAWQEGYRGYMRELGRPRGWLIIHRDSVQDILRLDRKGTESQNTRLNQIELESRAFHLKYAGQLMKDPERLEGAGSEYRSSHGAKGWVFALRHLGRVKGVLFISGIQEPARKSRLLLRFFESFLTSQIELAYKSFELNNFYETVHPRALALSTMHSVHRVISSSLRLHELLPRIGRLSAQVLKARGCSIMLVDAEREYLIPYFSFGESKRYIHRQRIRVGRGLQGRIASTGEFHLSRNSIAVPFIEDDIVGVIILWSKIEKQPFSKIDLEILKSLSEQAVVAIKNAQLFEETEKLTLGSIKAINELLDLNIGGDRKNMSLFARLVMELGKELGLSSRETTHLHRAILLLDTGTLAMPDKLWKKKGKLTKKEYDQIKRIPLRGANLLKSISSLQPVIPIVMHHHERFDGKGYPQGLKAEEIPIGARIVSVVNSYVAMVSKRAYREKMSQQKAIGEIRRNQGTQFDPKVVKAFLRLIQKPELVGMPEAGAQT